MKAIERVGKLGRAEFMRRFAQTDTWSQALQSVPGVVRDQLIGALGRLWPSLAPSAKV